MLPLRRQGTQSGQSSTDSYFALQHAAPPAFAAQVALPAAAAFAAEQQPFTVQQPPASQQPGPTHESPQQTAQSTQVVQPAAFVPVEALRDRPPRLRTAATAARDRKRDMDSLRMFVHEGERRTPPTWCTPRTPGKSPINTCSGSGDVRRRSRRSITPAGEFSRVHQTRMFEHTRRPFKQPHRKRGGHHRRTTGATTAPHSSTARLARAIGRHRNVRGMLTAGRADPFMRTCIWRTRLVVRPLCVAAGLCRCNHRRLRRRRCHSHGEPRRCAQGQCGRKRQQRSRRSAQTQHQIHESSTSGRPHSPVFLNRVKANCPDVGAEPGFPASTADEERR
ncbi:hypothetical protein Pan44_17730 [Caulifigura coniformis]|uniref:Uncharacterized protein n=1 Tax=Caulifigura coniformis TaxID=2527983 RepID=A0A517SC84_9PLAN|nr:hypothetical protein Pan44_17730 [Caulifigura coniformis]